MRRIVHGHPLHPDLVPLTHRYQSSSASRSPETTTAAGPLTAAIDNAPAVGLISSPTRPQAPRQTPCRRGRPAARRQRGCATRPPGRRPLATTRRPHKQRRSLPGMPQDRRRHDTVGLPQRSQRHLTANNAGCTTSTRSSDGAPGTPRSTSPQPPAHIPRQGLATGSELSGECRRGLQQFHRHLLPLRPLPRENENRPVLPGDPAFEHMRGGLTSRKRPQPRQQRAAISSHDHRTII